MNEVQLSEWAGMETKHTLSLIIFYGNLKFDSKPVISQVQLYLMYLMCWLRGRASAGLRGHYTSLCLEELIVITIATNIHTQ